MGCHLSKVAELPLRRAYIVQNTVELSSYEADSRRDRNNQSFDSNLSQNMTTALSSVAIVIEGNSPPSGEQLQSELQKLQGANPVAAALGAASSIPFLPMGKWFDSWMKEYEDKWEAQKAEIISKEAEISAALNNLDIAIQRITNLSEAGGFHEGF